MRALVVEDCLALSLHRVLAEHRKGRSAPFVLAVSLDHLAPSVRVRCGETIQEVQLAHHPHNLGGTRWYFVCECGRRTFTLYRPLQARHYRCRACYALRYRSENLTPYGRAEHRAFKLARRLGGSLLLPPARLKGMWHSTFLRERATAEAMNLRALALRLLHAA
jgi:hypothetical protein